MQELVNNNWVIIDYMESVTFLTMLGHLSQSLPNLQHLVAGFAYLLALLFYIVAFQKFHKIGSSRHSSESLFSPIAYVIGGSVLLFLPSSYTTLSNTIFGVGNILSYAQSNSQNIYSIMNIIIRTAGLIWFVRGAVLLTQASEPGKNHGPKGLLFVIAGIFSMNFETTIATLAWIMNQLIAYTLKSPPVSGS